MAKISNIGTFVDRAWLLYFDFNNSWARAKSPYEPTPIWSKMDILGSPFSKFRGAAAGRGVSPPRPQTLVLLRPGVAGGGRGASTAARAGTMVPWCHGAMVPW